MQRWENNIAMYLKAIILEGMDRIQLAYGTNTRKVLVDTAIISRVA
jgi:hypothetical protein